MRNRYIDTLRAAAILRVIVYHAFGWAWLTVALPAMGVMFALAGSLMAASLGANGARRAVTSRIRRLVPALWALGAAAVPLMLLHGWRPHRYQLLFWVLPVDDPPGSPWGQPFWQVLWYLRAYLWFVLVSPLLYLCYRQIVTDLQARADAAGLICGDVSVDSTVARAHRERRVAARAEVDRRAGRCG